ncbi:uncharacterized protein LOC127804874 [Diospyros lotus]|uniref:uncharacterized protein LOC127804874 n=1 Tax=Diospyros lotus TaxID=55363 RepID=UPI00225A1B46|nr:uncharacterized protein LOC127804874 [Diospyros lotus]
MRSAMAPKIQAPLLVCLLLLISLLSSGIAEGLNHKVNPYSLHKDHIQMNARKLLVHDVLDYDYTGPNPKHDPKKGRSGGGGRNP